MFDPSAPVDPWESVDPSTLVDPSTSVEFSPDRRSLSGGIVVDNLPGRFSSSRLYAPM